MVSSVSAPARRSASNASHLGLMACMRPLVRTSKAMECRFIRRVITFRSFSSATAQSPRKNPLPFSEADANGTHPDGQKVSEHEQLWVRGVWTVQGTVSRGSVHRLPIVFMRFVKGCAGWSKWPGKDVRLCRAMAPPALDRTDWPQEDIPSGDGGEAHECTTSSGR